MTVFAGPKPRPEAVAVCFGGVRRGPLGALRRALLLSLPSWAILGLSFIGNSALEILCHKPLREGLIGTLRLLKFRNLENYNPRGVISPTGPADQARRTQVHRQACYKRWQWAATNSRSQAAKEWYTSEYKALEVVDPSLNPENNATNSSSSSDSQATVADSHVEKPGTPAQNPGGSAQ